jgi:hypothetical protein
MASSMPRTVRASLWLLVGSQAAILLVGVMDPRPTPALAELSGPMLVVVILLVIALLSPIVFIAYRAYHARNWARWVHAVIFSIGGVVYVPTLRAAFSVVPVVGTLNALFALIQVTSVALLFVPESNIWYRSSAQVTSAT